MSYFLHRATHGGLFVNQERYGAEAGPFPNHADAFEELERIDRRVRQRRAAWNGFGLGLILVAMMVHLP